MARVTFEQAEKYYPTGGGDWFQLKNDGDVARVQFIMDSLEDIPMFTVHKVEVDGRERYVDCLREPGGDINTCPFCAAGIPTKVVNVVQMYQHDDNRVKIWERGRTFLSKLQGLVNRYNPLSHKVFEIERHGKAGDQTTKYEIYPLDGVQPADLTDIELPELKGTLIMDKTAEEMEGFLDTGSFAVAGNSSAPVRRRGAAPAETSTPARRAVANDSYAEDAPSRAGPARRSGRGGSTEVF